MVLRNRKRFLALPHFHFTIENMRSSADKKKIVSVVAELGNRAKGPGRIYLVGGSSVVLQGGRKSTIDIDLKLDPEPSGVFEAIDRIKNELDVNIELASPDHFIPELPGWRERSEFVEVIGEVEFFHFDFYSQALSKLERGHPRDLEDVRGWVENGKVDTNELLDYFVTIEPNLIRFPRIDAEAFRKRVEAFVRR